MIIYPKKEIKNVFGQILWHKDKTYEASEMFPDFYVVTCEMYGNEYPTMNMLEILEKFYTIEDQRDISISHIIE